MLGREPVTMTLWVAAFLSVIAIALMQAGTKGSIIMLRLQLLLLEFRR